MRRSRLSLLSCLLAFGLIAAACGSSDDSSSDTSADGSSSENAEGAAPEGEPIVLGAVLPASGAVASTGELARQGAELAVEQINANGGVLGRPLALEFKDSLGNPEEAVKIVREYDAEGVDFTWGFTTSSGCLAVSPIVEQLDMLMLSTFCQTNKVIGEEFHNGFFRVTTSAEMITRALAKAVQAEEPDALDWVSISPDYEYGHNTVNIFKNEMRNEVEGFQMLDETWPPFQSPSYSDYITQVADDPAQGVFSTLYSGDMLNMLKQQQPFGFLDDKVFLTIGMDLDVIDPMSASGDLPPTWDGIIYYADAFDNPTNTAFVASYQEKYGVKPTLYPQNGFITVLAYAAAIEAAGSTDVAAVREAMAGITFDSPMGEVTIRQEDHQAILEDIAIIKIEPTDDNSYSIDKVVLIPGADVSSPPNPGQQNPFDVES